MIYQNKYNNSKCNNITEQSNVTYQYIYKYTHDYSYISNTTQTDTSKWYEDHNPTSG